MLEHVVKYVFNPSLQEIFLFWNTGQSIPSAELRCANDKTTPLFSPPFPLTALSCYGKVACSEVKKTEKCQPKVQVQSWGTIKHELQPFREDSSTSIEGDFDWLFSFLSQKHV